jgi:uncharacterized protein (TIGR02271 family)
VVVPADDTLAGHETEMVQLLEEHAAVEVRDVTTGRVRISTHVETFEEMATADLTSDTVDVTRVAVGQPVGATLPQVRTEGDLTIVPVFEEVLVVEKRLMLKEELHIRKRTMVEAVATPVTLRRQTADVEHLGGE